VVIWPTGTNPAGGGVQERRREPCAMREANKNTNPRKVQFVAHLGPMLGTTPTGPLSGTTPVLVLTGAACKLA
jgi:hypothetical protein